MGTTFREAAPSACQSEERVKWNCQTSAEGDVDCHQDEGRTVRRHGDSVSLKRLQTDHVDEWRMHNIWNMEELDK
jgi:hypothetical protein